jgi:hypothetical protein
LAEDIKKSVGNITEKSLTIAAPITSRNPFFIASIFGSIGMFIVDHNGLLSIPTPIIWLPLAICFAPLLLVIAAALVALFILLFIAAAFVIVYSLLTIWYGIRIAYRKTKHGAKNLFKRKSLA